MRLVNRRQATLSHVAVAYLKEGEAYAAAHGDPYSFHAERGVYSQVREDFAGLGRSGCLSKKIFSVGKQF